MRTKVETALNDGLSPTMFSGVDASLDEEVKRRRDREPNGPSRRFDGSRKSSPNGPAQPASDHSRFSN